MPWHMGVSSSPVTMLGQTDYVCGQLDCFCVRMRECIVRFDQTVRVASAMFMHFKYVTICSMHHRCMCELKLSQLSHVHFCWVRYIYLCLFPPHLSPAVITC